MEWSEIDLDAALWRLPAERNKSARLFEIPLSEPVVETLRMLPRLGPRVFTLNGKQPMTLHPWIERVPEDIKQDAAESRGAPKLETMAELIVAYTEKLIVAYLTEVGLGDRTPTNPANVKAAIRKARIALEAFVRGAVDEETASIIPDDLDERVTARGHEVGKLRLAPYARRRRDLLCPSGCRRPADGCRGLRLGQQDRAGRHPTPHGRRI